MTPTTPPKGWSNDRITRLETAVQRLEEWAYGNGGVGISERIRNSDVKLKWIVWIVVACLLGLLDTNAATPGSILYIIIAAAKAALVHP